MKSSHATQSRTKPRARVIEGTARRTQGPIETAPPRRYDGFSVALHWLTLLLIIALFATAWANERATDGDSALLLLAVHRSLGLLIWLTTLVRLAWKLGRGSKPPLPASMPRAQIFAARLNELALYAILLAQPVTGLLQTIARGHATSLLGLDLPAIMARSGKLAHLAHSIHETTSTVLLALVGLHAGAALIHGLALRDGVLSTMIPGLGKSL